MLPINLIAVVGAALAAFILGFLFHGPVIGKLWMKLANVHPTGNEKFIDMVPKMLWNLLANLVTAYGLAVIYLFASSSPYLGGPGTWTAVICALWLWLGFLVTSTSMEVIWMGRSAKLWLFECACSLVVMVAMGAIIGTYQSAAASGLGAYAYDCDNGSAFTLSPAEDLKTVQVAADAQGMFTGTATLRETEGTSYAGTASDGQSVALTGDGETVHLKVGSEQATCNPKADPDNAPWNWGDASEE